jgi:Ca2+-binding RTX toxin-like protein
VTRYDSRFVPSKRVLAGAVVAPVLALWVLASPPAFAQLSFNSTEFPIKGVSPAAVVTSDFNGDGHLDLATANEGGAGGVEVLLGDGTGRFEDANQYPAGRSPISLGIGDFNADSHVDLAVANHASGDVSVLLGAGDGTFGAPTNYAVGGGCASPDLIFPEALAVGFFNADAHADLAVANFGCASVSILLGKGDGTFGDATNVDVGEGPDALATGDFNGDGNLDLIAPLTGDSAGVAAVLLGGGDGTFVPTAAGASAGPVTLFVEVAVGDFNGDSKADLAFASGDPLSGGTISVALGNGDGTFTGTTNYMFGDATTSLAVADFNADSVLDVATTDNLRPAVWVLLGVGDGTFGSQLNFTASSPVWVTVGNFNTDPLPDMATADPVFNSDRVTVLLNTTPPPSPAPTLSVGAGGSCARGGRQGTIPLALAASEEPASAVGLSMTSSNPDLVPTTAIAFGGGGFDRTLAVRPVAGRTGTSVITINRLSQGQLTGSVQVTVRVGANRADNLAGGDGADMMFGRNGADNLAGLGGNDLLCGGSGADNLSGGDGDDSMSGGSGNDRLTGDDGDDTMSGGSGNDALTGDDGHDTMSGGSGNDRLTGGAGGDRFSGGSGLDSATDLNPAEGDSRDGSIPDRASTRR